MPPAPAPAVPASTPDSPSDPVDHAGLASRLRLAVDRLHRRVRHEGNVAGEELTASTMAALATIERIGPVTLGGLRRGGAGAAPEHDPHRRPARGRGLCHPSGRSHRPPCCAATTASGRRFLARSRTRADAFLARPRRPPLGRRPGCAGPRALPVLEALLADEEPT